jgi:hypothetical protein
MRLFAIDTGNNITAFPAAGQIPEGREHFASEKELAKLATNWPAERLVQVWNSFAGVAPFNDLKPVKKFTDRKTAVARLWKAIQRLDAAPAPQTPQAAPTAREGSKKALVLEMLRRPEGATLQQIMSATGWMAHSVRGFLSGSLGKRMGLTIESSKTDNGDRVYRLAAR